MNHERCLYKRQVNGDNTSSIENCKNSLKTILGYFCNTAKLIC